MSTQPDEDLEPIYSDYLVEAERVKKERMRAFNQYRLGSFIGIFIMIAVIPFGILPPSAFWGGFFITVIAFVVANVMANKHAEKEADKTAQSRPGFTEFYKLYIWRNYWSIKMVTGEKYAKFQSIIGRRISE